MRRQFGQISDAFVQDDLAAERAEPVDERIRDGLRTTLDHGPADRLGEGGEDQGEGRREWSVEREHRVRRDPGEERSGLFLVELASGKALRRAKRRDSEAGQRQWVSRQVDDRLQQLIGERLAVAHQGSEQAPPGPPVDGPETSSGRRDRTFEDSRTAVVEGMGERRVGLDELDASRRQVHGSKEGRRERERQDRGADVMTESG